jgi:hypothetical protein
LRSSLASLRRATSLSQALRVTQPHRCLAGCTLPDILITRRPGKLISFVRACQAVLYDRKIDSGTGKEIPYPSTQLLIVYLHHCSLFRNLPGTVPVSVHILDMIRQVWDGVLDKIAALFA